MSNLCEIFGSNVFNDAVMKQRLPEGVYKTLKKTIEEKLPLDISVADSVAAAMRDWAIEKGATHYTHWFQPLTGVTAEKYDSFISIPSKGKVIMEFSGKELVKGEPDASSFPSGGIRDTSQARGYTAWDCTSPAFVKNGQLCIPTAFCSYTGEALDTKIPLLKSTQVLSDEAIRVLRALGNTTSKCVTTNVGPEQEYFLVDKKYYDQRKDLIYTGRTLFGAQPPKGQELEDHYFGVIKERVEAFMAEVNDELWKLGISAKTQHNEVAPGQHEIATIFSEGNNANDSNQLVMEILKKVALRHGLVCLLHEKPFAGINGSGKHNNWSMGTDDGVNLLNPGDKPHENKQFLIFMAAVISAVDKYADILRLVASNPGNDHRLGANEAPPAIISIFLGEQLENVVEQLEKGKATNSKTASILDTGVKVLPKLKKDATDRNRTSPFAFTGNKFEFRMVASSASIAIPNAVLNTAVADELSIIADRLEKASDVEAEVDILLTELIKAHKKVIFNGNGYTDEWVAEAEKRGLPNIKTLVEASKALIAEKNVKLMAKHGVLSEREMHARYEITLENYTKTINIEALTTSEMAKRQILPAVLNFAAKVAGSINAIKATGVPADLSVQRDILKEVSSLAADLKANVDALDKATESAAAVTDAYDQAHAYRFDVFEKMNSVREVADKLEGIVDKEFWPFPTYGDLLFTV
ncbi:glutamine synthetase III [Clostridium oryzae]|uniref:Glutamine synthetase n=1 Tax=Clostridium oryzae TaxID=1450648 RepID=A0A1V4IT02_9CLOT|nr:glutamine synthetase III [Clostridium oryzae]OPJ63033.1 glutamine synthetase [Clostridium oryzae]